MFYEGEAILEGSAAKKSLSVWHVSWKRRSFVFCWCVCVHVCVMSVRGTFSLSSRLIARASCSCSSSSPLEAGMACSRSGSSRDEGEAAREARRRDRAEWVLSKIWEHLFGSRKIYRRKKKGKQNHTGWFLRSGKSQNCCCMLIFHWLLFRALAGMARHSLPSSPWAENNGAAVWRVRLLVGGEKWMHWIWSRAHLIAPKLLRGSQDACVDLVNSLRKVWHYTSLGARL